MCAGYYAGGWLGIALTFPPIGISSIWPPNAILLTALLLAPVRTWWVYLLALLPTHLHLVTVFQPGVPMPTMLSQFAGNGRPGRRRRDRRAARRGGAPAIRLAAPHDAVHPPGRHRRACRRLGPRHLSLSPHRLGHRVLTPLGAARSHQRLPERDDPTAGPGRGRRRAGEVAAPAAATLRGVRTAHRRAVRGRAPRLRHGGREPGRLPGARLRAAAIPAVGRRQVRAGRDLPRPPGDRPPVAVERVRGTRTLHDPVAAGERPVPADLPDRNLAAVAAPRRPLRGAAANRGVPA